jgi:hypothetical protein
MMKKHYLRMLMAVVGVAGLAAATEAQNVDHLKVQIPYGFVAHGQTFPAGEYEVSRASDQDPIVLVLRNFQNHEAVVVLTSEMKDTPSNKSSVSFEKVGGQLFLSEIQTLDHLFKIPVTHEEMLQAQAKSHGGASAPGSEGGK